MMDYTLTKEEAVSKHREMWNWISQTTERQNIIVKKSDYFQVKGIPMNMEPFNMCYCCEYGIQANMAQISNSPEAMATYYKCLNCPLSWGTEDERLSLFCSDHYPIYKDGFNKDNSKSGLYSAWLKATERKDCKQSAMLAQQIADLPEKVAEEE